MLLYGLFLHFFKGKTIILRLPLFSTYLTAVVKINSHFFFLILFRVLSGIPAQIL